MSSHEETNKELIALLKCCDAYYQRQEQLAEHLKSGYMGLAMTRKSIPKLSLDNAREDIDKSVVAVQDASGLYSVEKIEDAMNAANLFAGLPPPPLRKAQKEFTTALHLLIDNANEINLIRDRIKKINGTMQQNDRNPATTNDDADDQKVTPS